MQIVDALVELFKESNFVNLPWQNWVMIGISFILLYLAIVKKFEPLLLIPIAFGMLLVNIYPQIMADPTNMSFVGDNNPFLDPNAHWYDTGVLRLIYAGVKSSIFPCLIFMGVGAMTDFGPLIANPSSLLLGAAAQLGIYVAFIIAMLSGQFTPEEAASIAIIGGADGPTAIFLTGRLAPHMLGSIAVAAYSYMALIPLIQPPIMKLLTTKKEREIKMNQLRTVSKAEKIIFPIVVTVICVLILPSVAPLLGFLMLGNLFKESGLTDRLSDTAQNSLCNIVTILLGTTVGATAEGSAFLNKKTLLVIGMFPTYYQTEEGAPDVVAEPDAVTAAVTDAIISYGNKHMIDNQEKYGYVYVDTAGTVVEISHPTVAGHRFIADRILEELPDARFDLTDVTLKNSEYKAVEYMYVNGLMNGTADKTFNGNAAMTKADFSALMSNMGKTYIPSDSSKAVTLMEVKLAAFITAENKTITDLFNLFKYFAQIFFTNDAFAPATRTQVATEFYNYVK